MALDAAGNAYLTGSAMWDEGFPTTPGALRFVPEAQTLADLPVFAFVTKFNPQGNQLVYSTLIGGTRGIPYPGTNRTEYFSSSRGKALALDAAGNAFVAGETASANFPTTPEAFKTTYNGAPVPPRTQSPVTDAFVLKLNATGSALLYSTLLGGNLNELSTAIAVDAAGNAHVTGYTESRNFPTTPGTFQPQSLDDPLAFTSDGFAVKLNATGSALLYATFLSSGSNDIAADLALDVAGNAYVTGWTHDGSRGQQFPNAAPFPLTPGAFQGPKTEVLSANAFVVKLNATGNAVYAARLGPIGPADEVATGIAIDAAGHAYVTGTTHSQLYPTTPGAFRRTGVSDNPLNTITGGFVTKVAPDGRSLVFSTLLGEPNERPNPHPKRPYDIAVDALGNAYIVGEGRALPGFAFVEKLNPTGSELLYSYQFPFGQGQAITLDGQGGVYFTGHAWEGFVTTPGAYRQQFDNSPFFKRGAFLAKISETSTNGLPLPLSSASPSPTVTPSPTPTGTPRPLFTVSGRITSLTGQPIAGASVYLNALVQLTDANGNYSFPNQASGSEYLLHAAQNGLSYFPESIRFANLNSNRTANLTQIPVTSGALHTSAATYDGNELAPGSIISAFGVNLAATTQVATTTPLPATLAGTRVLVLDRYGVERAAPLFFVSPTQINYLLPPETAAEEGGDQALVRIINSANQVFAARFEVAPVVPGFFTADASGRGLVAAVALRVRANGTQSYEPIARWDAVQSRMVAIPLDLGAATANEQVFLICFGTGFRRLAVGNTTAAQLGGITTPVSFAGPQGSLDGLDQLNLQVPRSLAGRGEVSLAFSVDGNNANPVKVVIK